MRRSVPNKFATLHRQVLEKICPDEKFREAILDGLTIEDFFATNPFIRGALAEMALSKFLGIPFHRLGGLDGYDPPDIIARPTYDPEGDLYIYQDDPNHKRIWLLSGAEDLWRVHGSIMACDGKKEIWWKEATSENEAAYHVPQSALDDRSLHRESQQ